MRRKMPVLYTVAARTGTMLLVYAALLLGMLVLPYTSRAIILSQAGSAFTPQIITIPAGGTIPLTLRAFCLNFGKVFPSVPVSADGLAGDTVRAALNYSLEQGYTESDPSQVELAVWFLQDGAWRNTSHDLGTEIVNNATQANLPQEPTGGISIPDAIAQNAIVVTATFVLEAPGHLYGNGTAQIRNISSGELKVYMPIGTRFVAPPGTNFQDLVVYALNTEQPVQQATPTTASATQGTATRAATTPTPARTATRAANTPTRAATRTATRPVSTPTRAAITPTAPRATATTARTPTTAPTNTAAPTRTNTPTIAPTSTPTTMPSNTPQVPTSTRQPTNTPQPQPTATEAPAATQEATVEPAAPPSDADLPVGGAAEEILIQLALSMTGTGLVLVGWATAYGRREERRNSEFGRRS